MPVIVLIMCLVLYFLSEASRDKKYKPVRTFYGSFDHSLSDYEHEKYIQRAVDNWDGDRSLWRLPSDLPYLVEFLDSNKYPSSAFYRQAENIAFKLEFDDGYWPNNANAFNVKPGYDPVAQFYQNLRSKPDQGTWAYRYRKFADTKEAKKN